MAFLRLANTVDTKRYYYEDTEEYIDLRTEITKKEAGQLFKFVPKEQNDIEGGYRFIAKAFKDLVKEWSLVDEKDKPMEVSVDTYELLDQRAAMWIDQTIGSHLRQVLGQEGEEAEKKEQNLLTTSTSDTTLESA